MGDAHAAVLRQLYDAAQRGDVGQVQALLAVLPADCVAPVGCALMAAICNDHANVVGAFAALGPPHAWTKPSKHCSTKLIDLAARHDSVHVVAVLVAAKVSVNGADALCTAVTHGHLSSVSLVLAMNPHIYAAGPFPLALHNAAKNGHADVVECLLRAKADHQRPNRFRETPLYLAACGQHEPVLWVLLGARADVNPPQPCKSPLCGAARRSLYGAPRLPHLPGIFRLLLGARADVNATATIGTTVLSAAAQYGCPDTVKLLLRAKVNVKAASVNRIAPLHYAAIYGQRTTARLLVHAKADVRAETAAGQTAATLARDHKHFELAAYFEAIAGL
jgi:ankyrin repeat protein